MRGSGDIHTLIDGIPLIGHSRRPLVRLVRICTRHWVYLAFGEVPCGTGRTGNFLAAHHWSDALPDVVVKAKGLGSGYTLLR
jgi:adenosylmethionine-8-amino-7-oxononanoate aminotransferase